MPNGRGRTEGDREVIKTPTTFVIGAVASCAYGLPAADEIYRRAKAVNVEPDTIQAARCSADAPDSLW
jgi:hypothetical protein